MLLVHALIGKLGLIGVSMRHYTARTVAYYRLSQNFFITPLPQIISTESSSPSASVSIAESADGSATTAAAMLLGNGAAGAHRRPLGSRRKPINSGKVPQSDFC
jgi:hypothetical protein